MRSTSSLLGVAAALLAMTVASVGRAAPRRDFAPVVSWRASRLGSATDPDGSIASIERRAHDSSTATASPFGQRTTLAVNTDGDPRFGTTSAFVDSAVLQLPSGLELHTSSTREATFSIPGDVLSLDTLTQTSVFEGRTWTSTFDADAHTVTSTSPEGRTVTATLDARGRPTGGQVPGLAPTSVVYDTRGRVESASAGTGLAQRTVHYAYGPDGLVSSVTDTLGRTTSFVRDAVGRVTTQILPDLRSIHTSYDAADNVTSITPPGRPAHTLTYTPVDLAQSYTPPPLPGVGHTVLAYNRDRQVELITRPDGTTIDPVYDPAGRLSQTLTPEGVYANTYSPTTGHLASTTSPFGTSLSFTYDGSLPTETTFGGAVAGAVRRDYDTSLRTRTLYVNGVTAVDYTYDDDSLVTAAGAMTLVPDPANGLLTATALGTVTTSHEHNPFAEPTRVTARQSSTTVHDLVYVRDAAGRITRKTETILGTTHVYDYRYDAASRLHEVDTDSVLSARYTYDANSNRTGALRGGVPTLGTVDAQDRLTEWGTQVFTYTANGELATRLDTATSALTQYGYDSSGALRTVALPSGDQIEYVLDPAGRRIGKRVNGVLEQAWLYQDGLRPIAELDGLGNVVSTFVYATGVNVPDYMVRAEGTYRLLRDHLGSVRLVIDVASGTIAQRMEHDEWGRLLVDTAPGFQPFGYAGGLWDADTGLVHFGAREYDPETGRWTSKDPIGFGGGDANLYGYVLGDPVNGIDLSGEGPVVVALVGAVVIATLVASLLDTSHLPRRTYFTSGDPHGRPTIGLPPSTLRQTYDRPPVNFCSQLPLSTRALEVHVASQDGIAANSRTTAVMATDLGYFVVASSGQNLTGLQQAALRPGELPARGFPAVHAEPATLDPRFLDGVLRQGVPTAIGTSRDFCELCAARLRARGFTITSPRTAVRR